MRLAASALLLSVASSNAFAHNLYTVQDFVDAYGSYSPEAMKIVTGLYDDVVKRYRGARGMENAIADGFIPFTALGKYHGYHWFDPKRLMTEPDPLKPAGLNFDENKRLVALFWSRPKYPQLYETFDLGALEKLPLNTQVTLSKNVKAYLSRTVPTSFDVFGPEAKWHSHENTLIENLGRRDANGRFLADPIKFTQSLPYSDFMTTFWKVLRAPETTLAIYESDPSLGYPGFNTLMTPGFHMLHMWIPLHNDEGLFAGTHPEVALEGFDEHDSFADGSHNHDERPHDPVRPETSLTAGELADRALAATFEATKIPGGQALCAGIRDGSITTANVVQSGLLFALVTKEQTQGTFSDDLTAAFADKCNF